MPDIPLLCYHGRRRAGINDLFSQQSLLELRWVPLGPSLSPWSLAAFHPYKQFDGVRHCHNEAAA
ncbi:MAG TPA: hypothetical protein VJS65_01880 [Verrucomicrobiae bacterium]|nr:hypothetical protein [Verrucomicrobiae bacterium]